MADILDRTVTITLRAVSDAYNNSITAAAKTTDAAIDSINKTVATASKGFDGLSTTVLASGAASANASQTIGQLTDALSTNTKTLADNATAAASAAADNTKVAQAAAATTTAQTAAAASTTKATAAVETQGAAANDAAVKVTAVGSALKDTGAKAADTGDKLKDTGAKTSLVGGFFSGLKDKATELIPGLGGIATMAAGVASGMGALEIAKQVGGWLLDVGTKALTSSGQINKINDTVTAVKGGFEDLVGRGIQLLATAFTATLGPAIDQLVTWLTEGMKWLKALADWFANSGTASAIFQGVLSTLATLFKPIIDALQLLWTNIQEKFADIQKFLQEHQEIWHAVLVGLSIVITNWVTSTKLIFDVIGLAIKGLTWLVQQQFKLITDAIGAAVTTASFLWTKLKDGVSAVGEFFTKVFLSLPGPVEDAFKAVAETIANWVKPIFDFIGGLIDKIPGLGAYKATFDSVSASITAFGQKIAGGTAAQKAANDAADEAKAKAEALAKAQQALGIMTADAADKAVKGSLALADTFSGLVETGTQNIAQLTIAAKSAYNDLESTRQKIEASGTDAQKNALDTQIKYIQDWAAKNKVALVDVQQQAAATAEAIATSFAVLDANLQKIGFISKTSVIGAANDSELAWETFFDRTSHGADEAAQFIQKTYTDLDKQIEAARAAGYTNEVTRLENMQAKVAAVADAQKVKLKEVQDAYDAISKSIAAIVPASDAADKAIEAMANESLAATRTMIDGMQSFSFETDKQVKAALDSVTDGYQNQIAIAGTSEAEKVRITEAAYAELKAQIEANGVSFDANERAKVQAALESMNQIMHENDLTLEHATTTTAAATEEQSASWTNLGKNMEKSMKSAASSMADALVSGDKSFGQVMGDMLKSLEKAFLQTFIKTGLDAVTQFVKKAFTGEGGLMGAFKAAEDALKSFGSGFSKIFGGGGDAAKTAVDAGKQASNTAGSALGGVGSALGGIGGAVSAIGGAVSAITGVIGIFQMKGQTKVLENIQNILIYIFEDTRGTIIPWLTGPFTQMMLKDRAFFEDWQWKNYGFEKAWADRIYGPDGLMGWFARLFQYQASDTATVLNAINTAAAAVTQAFGGVTIAAGFDPVVNAINSAAAAIVAAIQASATNTAAAFAAGSFAPVVSAVQAAAQAVVAALEQTTQQLGAAIAGIGSLPATVTGAADSGPVDLSPVTSLLMQVRDALSQGSLRPNVQLNVESGATANEVAQTIVRQLQLAGVIR